MKHFSIRHDSAQRELDEAFVKSLISGAKQGYQSAMKSGDQPSLMSDQMEKYASAVAPVISKAKSMADHFSKKTGISMPLATALIAAGIFGGSSAIPFAALVYFAKKPIMRTANRVFDAGWGAGEKVAGAMRGPQSGARLQPEHFSFKGWLMEQEGWGDYIGRNIGHAAGRVAGSVASLGGKVASAMKTGLGNVYQFVSKNPKEVARAVFLIGIGAATGGVIGNLSHQIKDMVVQKIGDVMQGVPAEEVEWLRNNVVLDQSREGGAVSHHGEVLLGKEGEFDTDRFYSRPGDDTPAGQAMKSAGVSNVGDSENELVGKVQNVPIDVKSIDKVSSHGVRSGDAGQNIDNASPENLKSVGSGQSTDISTSAGSELYDPEKAKVKTGYFQTGHQVTGDAAQESPQGAMQQAYRDIAKSMRKGEPTLMQKLFPQKGDDETLDVVRGLAPERSAMQRLYGRSAAAEVRSRLASPDTLTGAGAAAGAAAGAKTSQQAS